MPARIHRVVRVKGKRGIQPFDWCWYLAHAQPEDAFYIQERARFLRWGMSERDASEMASRLFALKDYNSRYPWEGATRQTAAS